MTFEAEYEDVFEPTPEGGIRVADNAPSQLINAIENAEEELDSNTEWVLRAVGGSRRSLEFATDDLVFIQTIRSTVFAKKVEEGSKILAVGVSSDGPLTKDQVEQAYAEIGREANLSPEELVKSTEAAKSLDSLRQARYFVIENTESIQQSIGELKALLDSANGNEENIIAKTEEIELELHNLLSSVYTFTETVDESLRSLGVLSELKHYNQKYQDSISTCIGLRHCIQHNVTFRVRWIADYNHEEGYFSYNIGIPIKIVKDESLYEGYEFDAGGDKHQPVEYYYGDLNTYLINLETLTENLSDKTQSTYDELQEEINDREIESIEKTKDYYKMKGAEIEFRY